MTEPAAAAPAGTEPAAQPAAQPQASNQPWYGQAEPDDIKYLESKGWTEPDAPVKVFQSYKNLEKLFSQVKGDPNRVLMMPKDMSNQEEVKEFYSKLGVPKDPSEYGFDPENEGYKEYAGLAHQLNLNKDQAKGVMEWAQQVAQKHEESKEAQFIENSKQELDSWRKEQGATYDEKIAIAKQAYTVFPELKANAEKIERALGTREFMNLMTNIGSKIGEAGSAGAGGNSDFGMSPSQAKQSIQAFQGDNNKIAALANEMHPGHAAAKAEWVRLHQFAYPE